MKKVTSSEELKRALWDGMEVFRGYARSPERLLGFFLANDPTEDSGITLRRIQVPIDPAPYTGEVIGGPWDGRIIESPNATITAYGENSKLFRQIWNPDCPPSPDGVQRLGCRYLYKWNYLGFWIVSGVL